MYKEILKSLGKYYPVAVLILRVDFQQRTFFVLSFPAKNEKDNSGFSSVVYEPHDIEKFLSSDVDMYSRNENLYKLLVKIISSEGVNSDYIDSKGGKMSLFRHVQAKKTKNNWIWNGIRGLTYKSYFSRCCRRRRGVAGQALVIDYENVNFGFVS